jgi:Protein of unknown function (DUF3153)
MKTIFSEDEDKLGRFIDRLQSLINRQLAIVCCAIAIALSGCVKYDTGVNFYGLNYGEIVEHIQLGEQLSSFSQSAVQKWVASIEDRAKQAQGRIERITDRELQVIIPFNNAQELVTKIERYFNPEPATTETSSKLKSRMQIDQRNFLLAVKNHLIYDIDLSALSIATTDPKVSVSSTNIVDLNFSIQSPWGVRNMDRSDDIATVKSSDKRQTTWKLKPGEINHLDVVFWLPNPLGIGAIFIVIISLAGYYLKYRQFPWQSTSKLMQSQET